MTFYVDGCWPNGYQSRLLWEVLEFVVFSYEIINRILIVPTELGVNLSKFEFVPFEK